MRPRICATNMNSRFIIHYSPLQNSRYRSLFQNKVDKVTQKTKVVLLIFSRNITVCYKLDSTQYETVTVVFRVQCDSFRDSTNVCNLCNILVTRTRYLFQFTPKSQNITYSTGNLHRLATRQVRLRLL
jgi:predicted Zn-dependent protease